METLSNLPAEIPWIDKNAVNNVNTMPIIHLNDEDKNLINLSNLIVSLSELSIVNINITINIGYSTFSKTIDTIVCWGTDYVSLSIVWLI